MQKNIQFPSNHHQLSGILDLPDTPCINYALFAHCFTCGKDLTIAARISRSLVKQGFAVLRFDFTGLGNSEGSFEDTNFSSNVADLIAAADFLRTNYKAPTLLIGHSLGGAGVLLAAKNIQEVKAIATIGAPASAKHVKKHFLADIANIKSKGEVQVKLGSKTFKIKKQFLEDIDKYEDTIKTVSGKALLIMHSPLDKIVSIDEAEKLYKAAKHPKSFISLDKADHLLSNKEDAEYAGKMIACWASGYLNEIKKTIPKKLKSGEVLVEEQNHKFTQIISTVDHVLLADEPTKAGGDNKGPNPYELLLAGLGACTVMTMRLYAKFKKLPLEHIKVKLSHTRIHEKDCEDCNDKNNYMEAIERIIDIQGNLTIEQKQKLEEIANRCPVHKTLSHKINIITTLK